MNHIDTKKENLTKTVENFADTAKNNITEIVEKYEDAEYEFVNSRIMMEISMYIWGQFDQISVSTDADVFICGNDGKPVLCQNSFNEAKEPNRPDLNQEEVVCCKKHFFDEQLKGEIENIVSKKSTSAEMREYEGKWAVSISKPIVVNGELLGNIVGIEVLNDGSLRDQVSFILRVFLIISVIVLFAIFVATYIFVYRLTKPLSQMVTATTSYAQGDFSIRVYAKRDDELGQLITAFNSMAAALSITESSRRSFVANVSHELKTPMTTIRGFIEGILDGTIPPEKQNHYLKIISSEIGRLSRLVVSMLKLSKIEAGQIEMEKVDFNISGLLIETLLTFEKSIEEKNIEIAGLDTLDNVFLNADRDMINQVIYNLIENAVKFTPESGRIDFSIKETDSFVTVAIKNTGEGIPSDQIGRIFERFYKVDTSRSYDVKGTGLGLYLVETLVKMHGGNVEASSVVGEYTQFTFKLPKK